MPTIPAKHALASSTDLPANALRSSRVHAFVELAKPGIAMMEVVTASVGFIVAQPWNGLPSSELYLQLLLLAIGVLFLSSSAGMFNHVLERTIDAAMQRTLNRPLPSGKLLPSQASLIAWLLLMWGCTILAFVGGEVLVLGVATVVLYVLVYTPLKRKTSLSLFIGGIPGALPVVGGWVAGGGRLLTLEALVLFLIMFWWQLPHFLALAFMHREDYKRGGIVLLADGLPRSLAIHSAIYSCLLAGSAIAWYMVGRAGTLYLIGVVILSMWLMYCGIKLIRSTAPLRARGLLLATYMYLMGVFLLMSVDLQ